jgi:hypothetical protein
VLRFAVENKPVWPTSAEVRIRSDLFRAFAGIIFVFLRQCWRSGYCGGESQAEPNLTHVRLLDLEGHPAMNESPVATKSPPPLLAGEPYTGCSLC